MKLVVVLLALSLGVACGGKKPASSSTSPTPTMKGTGGAGYGNATYGGNAYGGNKYGGKK